MAHRSNITQVLFNVERSEHNPIVKDVMCGMEINRHTAKHMIFRPEQTYYFCSEECRDNFLSGKKVA